MQYNHSYIYLFFLINFTACNLIARPFEIIEKSESTSFVGIGATIDEDSTKGEKSIIGIIPNSPAMSLGLKEGDRISKVDNTYSSEINLDELIEKIKGDEGTYVVMTVIRGGEELSIPIKREKITHNYTVKYLYFYNKYYLGMSLKEFKAKSSGLVEYDRWAVKDNELIFFKTDESSKVYPDRLRFIFANEYLIQVDFELSSENDKDYQFYFNDLSSFYLSNPLPYDKSIKNVKLGFRWVSESFPFSSNLEYLSSGNLTVSFGFTKNTNKSIIRYYENSKFSQRFYEKNILNANILDYEIAEASYVDTNELANAIRASRPKNNTILKQTSIQGSGTLKVYNYTKWDAVVKLVSPSRKNSFVSVYIHSGRSASVENIRQNSYKLIYALGEGWSRNDNQMLRISECRSLTEQILFIKDSYKNSSFSLYLEENPNHKNNSYLIDKNEFISYQ